MPRQRKPKDEPSPSPAPLTAADRDFIERIRTADVKIQQQELVVAEAAKKLREERKELAGRLTDLRALTRSLPLFDDQMG